MHITPHKNCLQVFGYPLANYPKHNFTILHGSSQLQQFHLTRKNGTSVHLIYNYIASPD